MSSERTEEPYKLYFFEIRCCEGTVGAIIVGKDFVPDTPIFEWPTYRVTAPCKNDAINEMIGVLEGMKDEC